jgi:hypothetical protein
MSVSFECCVLSSRGLCVWLITHQRSPECGVSKCDCEALLSRRPWLTRRCCALKKLIFFSHKLTYLAGIISNEEMAKLTIF